MRILASALVLVALAALVPACGVTKPQVEAGVALAGQGCQVLLYATDPALEPLCVLAEQAIAWGVELTNLPPGRFAATVSKQDQLYQLARSHGAKTVSGK